MITLLIVILCDFDIMNRLPQPDYVERDWAIMQADPNHMASYFRIYSEVEKEPHVRLVMRNWLRYNPLRKYHTGPVRASGRAVAYTREPESYEVGNVTGGDVVDFGDYGASAKYYYGNGMFYKPKPEPEPVVIPIEIKALILKLLMDVP